MAWLYPDEPLFAQAFDQRDGLRGYRAEVAADLLACCHDEIARRIDGARIFRQAA